jgi:hypothetical protein
MKNKWICPDCCWYDGHRFCLKGDKYNFDGEGVNGVTECAGFVKIKVADRKWENKNALV